MTSTPGVDRSHPWSTSEDDDTPTILFDEAGAVSWVNAAFSAITGWSGESCLDQSLPRLRRRLELEIDFAGLCGALARGRAWQGSLRLRARCGDTLDMRVRVDPLHDSRGLVIGAIAVAYRSDHDAPKP